MSDDLREIALKLGTAGPVKTLPASRLVQLLFDGIYILRTTQAVFVWEHPYYPQFYIPASDFSSPSAADPALEISKGEEYRSQDGTLLATQWILRTRSPSSSSSSSRIIDKVISFSSSLPAHNPLAGLVKIDFASVDQWFEEDTPIHVHPKDPYKRVDVLFSTRPIVVSLGGRVVARATTGAHHLHETGLPVRFYLPFNSLDPSILRPSSTRTRCPYKGEAEYYSLEIDGKLHPDLVWFYRHPLIECAAIQDLCCFYNEKVHIELDGRALD